MAKEVLDPEERRALQSVYSAPDVALAVFPSASQLEQEDQDRLLAFFKTFGAALAKDLAGLLQVHCSAPSGRATVMARGQVPHPPEESFFSAVGEHRELPIVFSLPRPFCTAICERAFGAPLTVPQDRPLSGAERQLIQELASEWLGLLGTSLGAGWLHATEEPRGADPTEPWLRVECSLVCGPITGAVRVGFSLAAARHLVGRAHNPVATESGDLTERLGDVPLEIHAVLGRAELSLDAVARLAIGDVIALDRHSDDLVDLQVDDRVLWRARAGRVGQNVVLEFVSQPKESESC